MNLTNMTGIREIIQEAYCVTTEVQKQVRQMYTGYQDTLRRGSKASLKCR